MSPAFISTLFCSLLLAAPEGAESGNDATPVAGDGVEVTTTGRHVQSSAPGAAVTFTCVAFKKEGLGQCSPTEFSVYDTSKKLAACCTNEIADKTDKVLQDEEHAMKVLKQEEKKETDERATEVLEQEEKTIKALELEEEEQLAKSSEQVDIVLALMLLGSVGIVMSLFYLVNHYDQDIQEYSWHVVSSTIAIFTSVIVFQAVVGVLELFLIVNHIERRYGAVCVVVIAYCQLLVWFVILQVAIGLISFHTPQVLDGNDSCDGESRAHVERMLIMKCWSTLLAHMTGFAAIHAGGKLQHLDYFSGTPLLAASSILVTIAFVFVCFFISDSIRSRFEQLAQNDLEKSDEVKIWDGETEDAENDIASLALSFLGVQAIRFQLGGNLPEIHGLEPANIAHDSNYVYGLLGCAVALALCSVGVLLLYDALRVMHVVQSTASMAFAWCIFYASKESVADLACFLTGAASLNQNTVQMRVLLACAVSCTSLALIFVLDTIEDMDFTGDSADKAVKNIIGAIGILVGFSWEQAFDGGVEAVADVTLESGVWYPVITKFILASLLACVIVPAWRKYILKNTCLHIEVKFEHRQRRTVRKSTGGMSVSREPSAAAPEGTERQANGVLYTAVPTEAPGTELMGVQYGI